MKYADRIIIFDGVCGLCHAWVKFVIRHDSYHLFKFTSIQSDVGQAIAGQFNLPTNLFETMLYVENDQVYIKSVAVLKIIKLLPWPMKVLFCGVVFPRFMRDFIYDRIAHNRYKLFGVRDECTLTNGIDKDRFL